MAKTWYLIIFICFGLPIATANAGDFDWLPKLSVDAKVDLPGFEVDLATRFKLPTVEVQNVVKTVTRVSHEPADAYMVLRLSEISRKSPDVVIETYRKNRGRGWGVIAKRLGIKPGSREFHALKRGHDLKRKSKKSKRKEWDKPKEKPGRGHNKGGGMGKH